MSVPVADSLPEVVQRAFDGTDMAAKVGRAYLLITPDADGTPRPCMLSAGEILVTGTDTYRLALWAGTSTGGNLRSGRPALLCFVDTDTVLYITGTPEELPLSSDDLDGFEVRVEQVRSDAHEGLPVTAPITYRCAGISAAELLEMWERQLRMLRSAP